MGVESKAAIMLKKNGHTFDDIEEHIKNYVTNDTTAIIYLLSTILITILIYASYFLIPYKIFWPFWIFLRGALFIRIYILFHDCTHSSYFSRPSWNWVLGVLTSGPSVTPFRYWQKGHLYHHEHVGDRGSDDGSRTILFTVEEYNAFPLHEKIFWRIIRDPIFFFTVIPFYQFIIQYRAKRINEWHSHFPTLWMIVVYTFLYRIDPTLCALDFLGTWLGAIFGFILFHLQHEVNSAYWKEHHEYNSKDSSLLGCTLLLVPECLKWSTLGIEYHHIHHLSTKVPGYNLRACHEEAPQTFWSPVTIVDGKKALAGSMNSMWNKETQRFETFWIYRKFLEIFGWENEN